MAIFEDYITLKEAGRISGYHSDYIGALIRSGKVDGKKVGKNWMVSEKAVRVHFSKKHYAPISNVFSTKKKIAAIVIFIILAAIFIPILWAFFQSIFSNSSASVTSPATPSPAVSSSLNSSSDSSSDSDNESVRQSLTEPVEPESTDAQVMQASQ